MHKIGLIVYPGFQVLGLARCATFELANTATDEPVYSIALLSERGGAVQTSAGFGVETSAFDQRSFDTLLVLGDNLIRPVSPGMVAFLRSASRTTRRLGSICTGAIALAEARYALMADGEQIHAAMYPGSFAGPLFTAQMEVSIRQHALESACFVVNSTAWLNPEQQAQIMADTGCPLARFRVVASPRSSARTVWCWAR